MNVPVRIEAPPAATGSPPAAVDAVSAAYRSPWRAAGAYLALTKPRIVELLLITTVPAMVLAARGIPPAWLIAATLIGGTATAGAANAINQFLDRDIDRIMKRTRRRPLPSLSLEPRRALIFGLVLGAAGSAWLALTVNPLSAALAAAAMAFYVLVYTMWLKRSSPQNIVIGGAAGAVPVLVGWAAVTGGVGAPAWALFLIVFMWTPPHFWALSLRYRHDYAAAGVPMLPVVAGPAATRRHIAAYSVLLVGTTFLLPLTTATTPLYPIAAAALGAALIARAVLLLRTGRPSSAMGMFHFSNVYLALLFVAVAADALLRRGP